MALSKEGLDPSVNQELERIVAKEPEQLTEDEAGFLRARADYLSKHDSQRFADVLSASPKKEGKKEEKKRGAKSAAATSPEPNPNDEDEADESDEEDEEELG